MRSFFIEIFHGERYVKRMSSAVTQGNSIQYRSKTVKVNTFQVGSSNMKQIKKYSLNYRVYMHKQQKIVQGNSIQCRISK